MQSCQDVLKGRIEGVFECGGPSACNHVKTYSKGVLKEHAMRRAISMQSCQDVLEGRIEGVFECGAHLSLRLHMGLNEGDVID